MNRITFVVKVKARFTIMIKIGRLRFTNIFSFFYKTHYPFCLKYLQAEDSLMNVCFANAAGSKYFFILGNFFDTLNLTILLSLQVTIDLDKMVLIFHKVDETFIFV